MDFIALEYCGFKPKPRHDITAFLPSRMGTKDSGSNTSPLTTSRFSCLQSKLLIRSGTLLWGGSRIFEMEIENILKKSKNQILFQYLRDKKKKREGDSKKGGGGVKIHPFHLPSISACFLNVHGQWRVQGEGSGGPDASPTNRSTGFFLLV